MGRTSGEEYALLSEGEEAEVESREKPRLFSESRRNGRRTSSTFAVLEELDLAETLPGFFQGFVRTAQISSFGGEDLVTVLGFLDHGKPPCAPSRADHPR
jgi:hypothetical protein